MLALEDFRKISRSTLNAGINPEMLDALTRMAYYKIREGVASLDQFVIHVKRAWNKTDLTSEERELVDQAWKQGKEDVESGVTKYADEVEEVQKNGNLAESSLDGINTTDEIDINNLLLNEDFKNVYNNLKNGNTPRKFANELTLEEEAAFKFYTNTSYYKFNQALISGSNASDVLEIKKLLNQLLDKIPSSPGKYFRGIGKPEITMLDTLKEGDEIPYKNFLSTTSERSKAFDFYENNLQKTGEGAMIEIISKNGKRIDRFSDAYEFEILHKSDSKFRLKKIDPNYFHNPDDVAMEGATPIKFKLYIIEEM